jgi:diguanylate cyclase (GGDEF)-like protein
MAFPWPDAAGDARSATLTGAARWHALLRLARRCHRSLFMPYRASEADAARFRARQMQAVLRMTPFAMLINIAIAAVVTMSLWPVAPRPFLMLWAGTITTLALAGLLGWSQHRRAPRPTAPPRALHSTAWRAALLSSAWAVLPAFLFSRTETPAQFFLGVITAGMLCGGAFLLASVPVAGVVWAVCVGLGALIGLLTSGSPLTGSMVAVLGLYTVTIVYSVIQSARTFGAQLMAEAKADHQHEVIGLLLRDFEHHTSDLLWEVNAAGRFVHTSQRLRELLALDPEVLQDAPAAELLQARVPATPEARQAWRSLRLRFRNDDAVHSALVALHIGNTTRWWAVSARRLPGPEGETLGWRGVAADHTEQHLAHRRLAWLAHNDALTGLANRAQFRELLHSALTMVRERGSQLAVVYADLDGFKEVNDEYGHAVGDALLRAAGERFLTAARRTDVVARLGGDEFALILRDVRDEAEVRGLVDRALRLLDTPVVIGERTVRLRSSLGVALAPAHGTDLDTLMNRADLALYTAKHGGGHRACVVHEALLEANRRRTQLEEALRDVVARGELHLTFQPQLDSSEWHLVGFEALLRWTHPELGAVPPSEFVPIAESIGLMPSIGAWVVHEACAAVARWPRALSVSINVSPLQLADPDFVPVLLDASQRLDRGRITLEVTESALLDDVARTLATLATLRRHGFRIALDDFGTGYSALGYLRRFSFDVLKIDRSFVRDLTTNAEARVLIDTILAMARSLGMSTVAEGVETEEEAALLRDRGCTVLQGYYVSRPITASQVSRFARSWASAPSPWRGAASLDVLPVAGNSAVAPRANRGDADEHATSCPPDATRRNWAANQVP